LHNLIEGDLVRNVAEHRQKHRASNDFVTAALAPDAHPEPKFRKILKRSPTPHMARRHRVAALVHVAILFFWNVNSSTAWVIQISSRFQPMAMRAT
jgi:hypothetical protein